MKQSTPAMLRFVVCTFVIFFAFSLCGWIVLGPFHLKVLILSMLNLSLLKFYLFDCIAATVRNNKYPAHWDYGDNQLVIKFLLLKIMSLQRSCSSTLCGSFFLNYICIYTQGFCTMMYTEIQRCGDRDDPGDTKSQVLKYYLKN